MPGQPGSKVDLAYDSSRAGSSRITRGLGNEHTSLLDKRPLLARCPRPLVLENVSVRVEIVIAWRIERLVRPGHPEKSDKSRFKHVQIVLFDYLPS